MKSRWLSQQLFVTTAAFLSWLNTAATASWQETVEADWLRQDAKRLAPPIGGAPVKAEDDAAGGVDGIKNGQWGFHTENERDPWWQVDLGERVKLDRIVVFNRCDGGFASRNAHLLLWLSDDGKAFREVYRHDGTVFRGFPDQRPLVVKLAGTEARFIRLGLRGQSYFHLDEVEVFRVGEAQNIALDKPATQSSTSQWSARAPTRATSTPRQYPVALAVQRGLQLAAKLSALGVKVEASRRELESLARAVTSLPPDASDETQRALYFRARWSVRELAFRNPLLNFDSILFVKRAPTMFPHMSDQHYGWWSRGGGGVYALRNFKPLASRNCPPPAIGAGKETSSGTVHSPDAVSPELICLTTDLPEGNFLGPDISFDGQKALFAYCRFYPELHKEKNKADKTNVPEDAFYHLYEMNVDGSGRRQLTHGRYDDFDPRYLPGGDIAFLSTRKGQAVQCTQWFSDVTRHFDLPNSYVRCGGDNARPVPVFTLHALEARSHHLRPLSAFENFEWTPSVANDGRLLYTRWDYIDRFNGHFFSLWSANQDGSNPQLVYGNYTVKPQVVLEARSVPGSSKLVFTACAHHSITGGSICLLDRSKGTEFEAPLTRLTPEVCFPETEGWPEHYYAHPWPLSEDFFLVAWADAKLPPHRFVVDQNNPPNAMGLYLYDAFGNLELLHRDPEFSSAYPMPIAPRFRPPTQATVVSWQGEQTGAFLLHDVYQGLDGVKAGSIKMLRIVGVPPKVQPHQNQPMLGVSNEDPGKYVLGTAPVERDGSAHFRVPSGVSVFFQALDENGLALQTMRSLSYVMPGQTLACVGCHEHRDTAPPAGKPALAALHPASKLTPGPTGSWPLRFDQLVQPVLDRQCVSCHHPGSADRAAARLDLTSSNAWQALLTFGGDDLKKLAYERDRSLPGQTTAATSKLWQLLRTERGHYDVTLTSNDRERLLTWMDTYAQRSGHFSDRQEKELADLRASMARILKE